VSRRAGVTLLELILVLAILGFMAGIVGLAAPRIVTITKADSATASAMELRALSIRGGHVVTGDVSMRSGIVVVSAYPDGRVLADSALRIDPLSGRVTRAPR
jgi:prepilin-type N-terminal cleavage/methylation domain-containing protein